MSDFAHRRTIMVDTQVRPSDVTKFPIINAMLTVPREQFVPDNRREAAYAGENLDIGYGRLLLEPRTFAKMLEVADIQPDDLVLDVACGLGYSAAVAAKLAEAVIALEDSGELCAEAEAALSAVGADNVAVVEGQLVEGAEKHGPYDVILIEGGVEAVPDSLCDQLKPGGRIVAIFDDGHTGTAKVGYRTEDSTDWLYAFNASGPVLPGFRCAQEFAL
ncbi:MAG: protein-L-isoaspartate O-methyltransferase family protein [Boseongicola sp.]